MEVTIKDVLNFLEKEGWSELIDSRWERRVTRDIVRKFPNISIEVLDEALDAVILY